MPISIERDPETRERLKEQHYRDEGELQGYLELYPYLIADESESEIVTVAREVGLPAAGILDLLMLDKQGLPIAVEVKLARNAQSRRSVTAQAFDYIADLSSLTFEELDARTDNALFGAVVALAGEAGAMACRERCAANLRAGRIRLVVAVDSAPDDLVRIVRYIADHSDIDVRLVAVSKYGEAKILIPRLVVRRLAGPPIPPRPTLELDRVAQSYDRRVVDDEWRSRGRGATCRSVYPESWPGGRIHYEFLLDRNRPDEVGAELHLEHDTVRGLADGLAQLAGHKLSDSGPALTWDPTWFKKRGRLLALVAKDDAEGAAAAMLALIKLTRPLVEKWLAENVRTAPPSEPALASDEVAGSPE